MRKGVGRPDSRLWGELLLVHFIFLSIFFSGVLQKEVFDWFVSRSYKKEWKGILISDLLFFSLLLRETKITRG